jgi:hypothetical protein
MYVTVKKRRIFTFTMAGFWQMADRTQDEKNSESLVGLHGQ